MKNLLWLGFNGNETIRNTLILMAIFFNLIFWWADEELLIPSLFLTALFGTAICFVLGIIFKLQSLNEKKVYDKYERIFAAISLISPSGHYPVYVGEDENEYLQLITFETMIPLELWQSKKNLLETYLNAKITKICNAENDNNLVYVYIRKKDLPQLVEWEDDNILVDAFLSVGIDEIDLVHFNLESTPHVFVAGETGSGKSNILKCLIYQCLVKSFDVKLIDFKRGVSFSVFRDYVTIYSDYEKIRMLLDSLVEKTNECLDLFVKHKVEDIKQYNHLTGGNMKRTVVFIDELAELMKSSDKEASKAITASLETLTRISRAAGIHLIMGLQRPDSTIVNGQIKNNVSLRICGRFTDPEPSRIMLHNDLAMKLPNVRGRFIMRDNECREFQAFYITNKNMLSLEHINTEPLEESIDFDPSIILPVEHEPAESEQIKDLKAREKAIDFNYDDIL